MTGISPISNLGSYFPSTPASAKPAPKVLTADDLTAQQQADADAAKKAFMDFAKKSIAERMQDDWLKQHGLTKEEFDKMPAEKHDAIAKQMADDIKQKLKEAADKRGKVVDLTI